MKIFITGATGFVGRYLVKELVKDHQVTCLTRNDDQELKDLGCIIKNGDLSGDVDIGDAQVVFHLAAIIQDDAPQDSIKKTNIDGTRKMVGQCKKKSAKLVYMSSTAAVGSPKYIPMDENHPYDPKDNYGISKMESEKIIKSSGIDFVILRPPVVYGDSKTWLKTIKMVKKGFPVIGDGKNRFHCIYVKNLVEACKLSIWKGSGIYFVADPDVHTFNDFYKSIAISLGIKKDPPHIPKIFGTIGSVILVFVSKITGKRPIITRNNIRRITQDREVSIEKAKKELGYEGKYSLNEGIKETVDTLRLKGAL